MLTRLPHPSPMPLMDLMCMTMMMDPSTPVMQLPLLAPTKRPIKIKADSGSDTCYESEQQAAASWRV